MTQKLLHMVNGYDLNTFGKLRKALHIVLGDKHLLDPALFGTIDFGVQTPTALTLPRREISPVTAISWGMGGPSTALIMAAKMATPAEGHRYFHPQLHSHADRRRQFLTGRGGRRAALKTLSLAMLPAVSTLKRTRPLPGSLLGKATASISSTEPR